MNSVCPYKWDAWPVKRIVILCVSGYQFVYHLNTTVTVVKLKSSCVRWSGKINLLFIKCSWELMGNSCRWRNGICVVMRDASYSPAVSNKQSNFVKSRFVAANNMQFHFGNSFQVSHGLQLIESILSCFTSVFEQACTSEDSHGIRLSPIISWTWDWAVIP